MEVLWVADFSTDSKVLVLCSIHLLKIDYPVFLTKYTHQQLSMFPHLCSLRWMKSFLYRHKIFLPFEDSSRKLSWRSTCISLQHKSKPFSINYCAWILMEIRKASWQRWTKSMLSREHTSDFIEGIRSGDNSSCRKQEDSTISKRTDRVLSLFHLFYKWCVAAEICQ